MNSWEEEARNMLRAEMQRRGVNFKALQERLEALGIHETSVNLSNKMARGKFSFAFALQCMAAMEEDLRQPARRGSGEKLRARPKAAGPSRQRS